MTVRLCGRTWDRMPRGLKHTFLHSQNRSEIQFEIPKVLWAENFLDGGDFVFCISISN